MLNPFAIEEHSVRRVITINNAKHEAGHWITGWIHHQASCDVVIATTTKGSSYCNRKPSPDFYDLPDINDHLGKRIINLLSGAKAESLVLGSINNDMYCHLISDYEGAWPDYFVASELFRYYYRSIPNHARMSFEDEWRRLEAQCEDIVISRETFIQRVAEEAVSRLAVDQEEIKISQEDMLKILNRSG